jgi:hypothetical protein
MNSGPIQELITPCPLCNGRVVALVLAEAQPGGLVRRWFGRCGVCDWRLMMSATGPVGGGPDEEANDVPDL